MALWGPAFLLRPGALIMIGVIGLTIALYVYRTFSKKAKPEWRRNDDD